MTRTGKALCDGAGRVGGIVIDHDDLVLDGLLPDERAQAVGEAGLFVARGNDDRDLGRRLQSCQSPAEAGLQILRELLDAGLRPTRNHAHASTLRSPAEPASNQVAAVVALSPSISRPQARPGAINYYRSVKRLACSVAVRCAFLLLGLQQGSHPPRIGSAAPNFTITDSQRTVVAQPSFAASPWC